VKILVKDAGRKWGLDEVPKGEYSCRAPTLSGGVRD
jgi:hypothetical protein